jgi:hypothetical protein
MTTNRIVKRLEALEDRMGARELSPLVIDLESPHRQGYPRPVGGRGKD